MAWKSKKPYLISQCHHITPMRYLASIIVILLYFSAAGFGVDYSNLQKTVDGYNEKVDQSPPLLRALLGEEIVDITMLLNNGTIAKWGLETENARIVRFQNGGIEAPTIEIYATQDAIDDVLGAQDAVAAYQKAEKAGQIKIEGNTPEAKAKAWAALSNSDAIKYFFSIIS